MVWSGVTVAMEEIFQPRGMNRSQARKDGWVGGRADTWRGHWQENPASRAGADVHRMVDDETYAADIARTIRDRDTMEQTRMPIGELLAFLLENIR